MKKIAVLIIIILVFGAYLTKSNNDLNLKNQNDLQTFIKVYFGWVYDLVINVKDITGYATTKTWLPKNINETNRSTE